MELQVDSFSLLDQDSIRPGPVEVCMVSVFYLFSIADLRKQIQFQSWQKSHITFYYIAPYCHVSFCIVFNLQHHFTQTLLFAFWEHTYLELS